jgi:hypothetical protein
MILRTKLFLREAAAAPPDANVLEIRAQAADAILGPVPVKKAEDGSARRVPSLFERLLGYGPHAVLAASLLVSHGWRDHIFPMANCRFMP